MTWLYNFLFIALPYVALTVFLIGTIYRYRGTKFKFSSLSSEFLEGKKLFWGSVPFHWSISILFWGHLIAFLIPEAIFVWNAHPLRLLVLEVTGFIVGIAALVGLFNLIVRRTTTERIRSVTSPMDLILEVLLLVQIFLGLWVAYAYRWGSSWFASAMAPYLKSIFYLNPQTDVVVALPVVVQLHIAFAFLIVLMVPFTRLVHLLVYPFAYLWRPYQRVMWYWSKKQIRNPKTPWTLFPPKNN